MGASATAALSQLQSEALRELENSGGKDEDHPAFNIGLSAVQNVAKRVAAETRVAPNDVAAVELMAKEMGDTCLYYHPQDVEPPAVAGGKPKVNQHLRLALCSPVQAKMLKAFGTKLIFMDAVYGVGKHGFPILTLLVKDDFGNGFPVVWCISSTEDKEAWKEFLVAALAAAGLTADGRTFMIDKSKAEMAAITEIGANYLLCTFHVLQEWDRYLKSADSGVHGRSNQYVRDGIFKNIKSLLRIADEAAFDVKSDQFENYLKVQEYSAVLDNYLKNWKPCAKHWAGESGRWWQCQGCTRFPA